MDLVGTVGKMRTLALGGKSKKNGIQDRAKSETLERYWNVSQQSRKEIDWRWFNYDIWVSGNHYARWNKFTQQITETSNTNIDGRPKIIINKTYTTIRAVRSHVLQNRPKAEVTPYNLTPENIDQAVSLNRYLDYLHDHLHMRQSLRASLWHALKYSVGFWQVMYDEDADDGEGGIVINVVDPYDLYFDPTARFPSEARYVILAVRRNLADLKEDPKYKDADWEAIGTDRLLSSSTLKARLIQYERGDSMTGSSKNDEGTVIVKEVWYKESQEEEYELEEPTDTSNDNLEMKSSPTEGQTPEAMEAPKAKGKRNVTKYMLCTMIGGQIIRKPFDTKLKRFPFFRLASDVEPLSMYGHGWVRHLIPVNRLLERLEGSAAEYNEVVNKAQLMAPKGNGIRTINNEHGSIVEYKRGFEPTSRPIPPLNPSTFEQIVNANRYIEDIGCNHEASMGREPSGVKSGVGIEALQEADSNNLSELTENTSEFLQDVYEYILELASEKFQFARSAITFTTTGERVFLKVVGEGASEEVKKQQGVTIIPKKSIVKVNITSDLAYTADGRRQAMKDLVSFPQMQNLPPEYILEAYSIGPIADIVKQMEEQLKKSQDQQAKQAQDEKQAETQSKVAQSAAQAQIDQQNQPQPVPGAGAKEAIAFIRMILNGQKPALPAKVEPDFIQYLDHFMQSPDVKNNGTLLSILQNERDQAVLHLQGNAANVNGVT